MNDYVVRVTLPFHLCTLAGVNGTIDLDIDGTVTTGAIVDALEARYPMLNGTIRDHITKKRRPFVRYFACQRDLSHESPDTVLPEAVASGLEPFRIVGAIAGG